MGGAVRLLQAWGAVPGSPAASLAEQSKSGSSEAAPRDQEQAAVLRRVRERTSSDH